MDTNYSSSLPNDRRVSKFVRLLHGMFVSHLSFLHLTPQQDMIHNEEFSRGIGFSSDGCFIELRDVTFLSDVVLPKYFNHGSVSSFRRQLNNYGFRRHRALSSAIDGNAIIFGHPMFIRDREDLLAHITRKKESNEEESEENSGMEVSTLFQQNQVLQEENAKIEARIRELSDRLMLARQAEPSERNEPRKMLQLASSLEFSLSPQVASASVVSNPSTSVTESAKPPGAEASTHTTMNEHEEELIDALLDSSPMNANRRLYF